MDQGGLLDSTAGAGSVKTTDVLSSEHRVIDRVLSALETGAWLFSLDETFRPGFFIDAIEFIRGFADGIHHKKEEGILFKALIEVGTQQEVAAVRAMLHEHELARKYTDALQAAVERLYAGDPAARPDVITNARRYAALLRQHIGIEDQVVFPMADCRIPPDRHAAFIDAIKNVEAEANSPGEYEKYLALAGALDQEIEILSRQ